jgi:uncharacterized phage protein (TIGR01671 family)
MNPRPVIYGGVWYESLEYLDIDISNVDSPKGKTLMQYTGLKDSAGVEIYEGDVVAITTTAGSTQVWSVEFDDGGFQVYNQLNSSRKLENSMSEMTAGPDNRLTPIAQFVPVKEPVLCKVLGNILENPELLQGEKI